MTDKELTIIVPTRSRISNTSRLIAAWQETGAFEYADMVLAIDQDDEEYDKYLDIAELVGIDTYSVPHWIPMVPKLNLVAKEVNTFAVGFMGDDHLPKTDGWAATLLNKLKSIGVGIVYGDDLYQGTNLPTHWVMTTNIVKALGDMIPAPLSHWFCDNVIMDLGQAAKCIHFLNEVVIEHLHPFAKKAAWDDTYNRANNPNQIHVDSEIYVFWSRHRRLNQAIRINDLIIANEKKK